MPTQLATALAVLVLALLAFAPAAGAKPAPGAKNAAYIAKAHGVAQRYWHARRPGSDCSDRPVPILIVKLPRGADNAVEAGPGAACTHPYDPTLGPDDPANALGAVWGIRIGTPVRDRGWLTFCQYSLWGWGMLATPNRFPSNPDKLISGRKLRRVCGKAPRAGA